MIYFARVTLAMCTSSLVLATLVAGVQTQAATPAAYAALDKRSASACMRASGLREARVAAATRFSDTYLMDARVVTGIWPQAHMKGAPATMLCLYNRKTRRAETQEMSAVSPMPPIATTQQMTASVTDVWWRAENIGGAGSLDRSDVTLWLGSDGKMAGKSGCNNYSVNYAMNDMALKVYPPMMGTKMMCTPALMAQEEKYRKLLTTMTRMSVLPTTALVLSADDGTRIQFFRAEPERTAHSVSPTGNGKPVLMMMRCGPDTVRASFSSISAGIMLEDGKYIDLPDATAKTAKPESRIYTNGRVSLMRTIENGQTQVMFARGKMAFTPCNIAQNG